MTQQLGDGRIAYLQARSAHDTEPSLSAEQAEDVSEALAFTAGAHSDRRFASVFVTGADGLRLVCTENLTLIDYVTESPKRQRRWSRCSASS